MKTVAVAFFILLSCQIGHALECYKCDYGCLFPSKTNCSTLESCATYKITVAVVSFTKKGCLATTACSSEASEAYLGVTVKTTPSCCNKDLCNSAVVPRVSAITGFAVLLSLWLAKLL